MFSALMWSLVFFLGYRYFIFPKIQKNKEKHEEKLKDQLLRLFVPGEKLRGSDVHERLTERTGGRCIGMSLIYKPLKSLVSDGRLRSETSNPVINGQTFTEVVFFLPER